MVDGRGDGVGRPWRRVDGVGQRVSSRGSVWWALGTARSHGPTPRAARRSSRESLGVRGEDRLAVRRIAWRSRSGKKLNDTEPQGARTTGTDLGMRKPRLTIGHQPWSDGDSSGGARGIRTPDLLSVKRNSSTPAEPPGVAIAIALVSVRNGGISPFLRDVCSASHGWVIIGKRGRSWAQNPCHHACQGGNRVTNRVRTRADRRPDCNSATDRRATRAAQISQVHSPS